ncbi:MAG: SprT family zinc-dependent metalloprotease [Clostridia bacterium]|nr:SprT family zinc-dependent metalloprotease [Clostridia bacterium]
MIYQLNYGGQVFNYEIIEKKVKNINIRIVPSGKIIVSCKKGISQEHIHYLLLRRINWIIKTQKKYKENNIIFIKKDLTFVDGENFSFLGKDLRIKVLRSNDFSICYDNNYLYIYKPNNRGFKIKFNEWFNDEIKSIFNISYNKMFEKFKKYNVKKPDLHIQSMKTKWGVCNNYKHKITINKELIKVPTYLLEYVICHELTHLLYSNHSKNFYNFLYSIVPDWKERKNELNKYKFD